MRILRWAVVGLSLALSLATFGLFWANRPAVLTASWGTSAGARDSLPELAGELAVVVFYLLPAVALGALVLRRHPRHRIGWLLVLAGLAASAVLFFQELTIYTYFTRPAIAAAGGPLAALAAASAWMLNVIWVVPVTLHLWLVSVFPDGRLPSPRWRWLHLAILLFAVPIGLAVLSESPMHSAFGLANPLPFSLPGGAAAYGLLFGVGVLGMILSAGGIIVLTIQRFRRARGEERQQFQVAGAQRRRGRRFHRRWPGPDRVPRPRGRRGHGDLCPGVLPIGIGVAVLRYRLYDVDLIIRRTLVYSILTTLLALIYFGGITLLQLLLPRLTGTGASQLILVVSTLAIAALFLPLRQRVQTFIDRRFYRRRYDAAQILSAFAEATRDDPDIDRLTDSLVDVVNTALQSESVGVWLRSETEAEPSQPTAGR